MGRMAAKFFGREIGESTTFVYDLWQGMGLIVKNKDKVSGWELTDFGRQLGGRMSQNSYCPVPTFVFEVIEPKMREYFLKHKK